MKLQININFRIVAIVSAIFFLFASDIVEAQYSGAAVAHSHRATRRRTAVVVSTVTHEKDQEAAAAAQQQEAAPATTTQEAAPATTTHTAPPSTTPEPKATDAPLPIDTVISKLPEGCVSTPVNNVEYYHCGPNYYRAVFQENTLVYVTTDPSQ